VPGGTQENIAALTGVKTHARKAMTAVMRHPFLCAVLVCASVAWSGAAHAQSYDSLLDQGYAAIEAGNWSDASKAFKQALKVQKGGVEATWGLGLVMIRKGDFHGAKGQCTKFTKTHKDSPWSYTCLGYAYLVWKKWGLAQESFGKALAIDPNFALAIAGNGHALVIAVKTDEAVKEYKKALEKDPQNIEALLGLAEIYVNRGAMDDAAELCEKAVAAHPGSCRARLMLARALGKGDVAIGHAKKALEIRPGWDEGYLVLGEVSYASGKYPEAINALTEAIKLEPGYVQAEKLIGMCYYEQGEYTQAIEKLGIVLTKVPNLPDAAMVVAMSHDALNEYDTAVEAYKTAINLDSKNPVPLLRLGDLYYRMGKSTSALSMLDKAIALKSDLSLAHKIMGDIYFENKQYLMSGKSYEKALAGDRKDIDVSFVEQRVKQIKSMTK